MVAFNPDDPAFLADPFPFYALGRLFSPAWVENPGVWAVFGYEDCAAILRDHETWSSQPPPSADGSRRAANMLFSDPPAHDRLRGLVSQVFTPRMVELLEPRIREVTCELLDTFAGEPAADIVDALAYPLPVVVIAEILGVPPEDRENFRRWSNEVVSVLGSAFTSGGPREISPATVEAVGGYFREMVEARRAAPRGDLLSGLVAAEHEGTRLSFDELMQMLVLLLVAGNETTTNLIANTVLELIAHPGELTRVRAEMALAPSLIEEVLRFSSPVQATARRAKREVRLGARTIAPGQAAVVFLGAANRDPAVFPEPDRFDAGRTPNRHLGFGLGVHFCLGAPLARLEARIAIEELLQRYRGFARLDDAPLPRVPTFIMHGVRALPVALSKA